MPGAPLDAPGQPRLATGAGAANQNAGEAAEVGEVRVCHDFYFYRRFLIHVWTSAGRDLRGPLRLTARSALSLCVLLTRCFVHTAFTVQFLFSAFSFFVPVRGFSYYSSQYYCGTPRVFFAFVQPDLTTSITPLALGPANTDAQPPLNSQCKSQKHFLQK